MALSLTNYVPLLSPIMVVSPHLVVPYSVDLTICKKAMTLSAGGSLAVADFNGNIMFKVKGKFISLHDRRILLDAHNIPILSFKKKLVSAHKRWQVFRGDSSHGKDLLFTVKQSSIIQDKSSVEVFLAENNKEEKCDFKVIGSWLERSCSVFVGDSTTIIAQVRKKHAVENVVMGKEGLSVRVFPNVDYAFIVALVMILDQINNSIDDD